MLFPPTSRARSIPKTTFEAMEVTSASVIEMKSHLKDSEEGEECPFEEPSGSTFPVKCEPEEVLLVEPKTEPDQSDSEESIKEEYPEYHGISPEVCIEEANSEDSDILLKCAIWGEGNNTFTPVIRQFTCPICNKGFLRKGHLQRHMPIHNEQKDYKCDICLREFTEKSSLKNHLFTHSKEKPFKCTICSRGYSLNSYLKKHILMQHTKPQMVASCTVCRRNFADVESLEEHLQTHIQLKKYTCNVCSRDFSDKSGLNKHYVVHSKEKRFECTYCSKKFGRSDHLSNHLRMHVGKREHICPTCGKSFNLKGSLKKHLLIHSNEKKHQCPHCFKKFGRLDYFNVHLAKQHSINNASCTQSDSHKSLIAC